MTIGEREQRVEIERASTLELFLDLVFVFTVTQLTELVSHPHGLGDYGRAALILAMTWWMYDAYVWLTGNVVMDRPAKRLALFAGMGGFLLMALAIPGAFGPTEDAASDTGVVFGLGFLLVTVIHTLLFSTAPNSSAQAIWRIAPFNLGAAALVLGAGLVATDWRWPLWLAAVVTVASSTLFGRARGWSLSSSHFVERHALVIIVALGESVVAIGVGASGLKIDVALAVTALLGLALSATLWWVYFDQDDAIAERVMSSIEGDVRNQLGMLVAYVHMVMIAGVVLAAAGVKLVVAHPTAPADTATAWNLALGVLVYLLGEAAFRAGLGLGRSPLWLVASGFVLATVPLGLAVNGLTQLAAVVALMVVLIVAEPRRPAPDQPA